VFKPMLASDADLEKLRFPLLASAKLDGIRAVVTGGVVYSRTLKPIPNEYVQERFRACEHLDGELIVGEPTSKSCYRDTMSGVMTKEGTPEVRFFAFDHIARPTEPYLRREKLIDWRPAGVERHPQHVVTCLNTLLALEEKMLEAGYEGLILRHPDAPYKFGRSTVREGYLLKLKRFVDDEFVVMGYEERMHNGNEAKLDELGRTKRSSHKDNKVGRGDLGALILQHPSGAVFNCGTGFTDAERKALWIKRDELAGKLAKVKFFAIGVKDLPRHPVFLGFRSEEDK